MPSDRSLWINGEFVAAQSGEFFDTTNPGNGQPICRVAKAGSTDVDAALAAARRAHPAWKAMSGVARGRVLRALADTLRAHRRELAELETRGGGKPIAETPEADVDSGADCLEYFAGQAASIQGEYQEVDGGFFYTRPSRWA